jgi:transposase
MTPSDSRRDRRLMRRRGRYPRHQRGSPDYPNHPSDVPCPLPRRIAWVRVSIASPRVQPSPIGRRVGIRIVTFEMLWGGRWGDVTIVSQSNSPTEHPMSQLNDLSRSLTSLEQDSTIIAVIEMSQSSWLVAGIVPGIERHPLKKLEPSEEELVRLLMRWRAEATKMGRTIMRIAVAFEAGRDGFWLARWLRARDIETYVIHPTSVAVSREHRRAKTDRLDTGLLKRVFIGWLRGEPDHCHMAAIPTLAEEDAKRPNREREGLVRERTRIVNRMKSCLVRFGVRTFKPTLRKAPVRLATLSTPEGVPLPPNTLLELRRDMARLRFVMDQIKEVEEARAQRLEQAPQEKSHAIVRLISRVIGVGVETADMLVHEVLARNLRDRRAVARYAGLTGAPDESGARRREKGLAKAGNARVRRGMIQLAWRFLLFQKDSALTQWYRARTENAGKKRKTMIVALARKLLIALWRLVTTGEVPTGVVLRAA